MNILLSLCLIYLPLIHIEVLSRIYLVHTGHKSYLVETNDRESRVGWRNNLANEGYIMEGQPKYRQENIDYQYDTDSTKCSGRPGIPKPVPRDPQPRGLCQIYIYCLEEACIEIVSASYDCGQGSGPNPAQLQKVKESCEGKVNCTMMINPESIPVAG